VRTRFLVIHNPKAGPAARRRFHVTLGRLKQLGAYFEIVDTARHGEAMRVAADAARDGQFDAVVAAGGDGTVHDVAEGLVGSSTPLGIIPLGTANVLAREIGLHFSPVRLAQTLVGGNARPVPVGQVNGRPFLFVIGVGFDARAVRYLETSGTRLLGQGGFAWPVLQALASDPNSMFRVRTDRGEVETSWAIVTRAKHYAAGLTLTSLAGIKRSGFYVVRFAGTGPLTRLRQLAALATGLASYDPGITVEPARWVTIEGKATIPVQIDGESLGELPLEIALHPKSLNLIFSTP
jgi:diacylglycerol kinase (ATP)